MSSDSVQQSSAIEVRLIAGRIGAEIRRVHLSGKLEPATIKAIRQAILLRKVVFVRSQDHLNESTQEVFGRLLGD